MLRSIAIDELPKAEYVPQAIIRKPVSYLSHKARFPVEHGFDDFDEFVGGAFVLENDIPFTIKHYKGHPENTATVYLPMSIQDLDDITQLIHVILQEFHIEEKYLFWQRKDDPNY